MKILVHSRGDIFGMFLLFLLLTLGLWQLLVAWKRLNGLSLTGYPDRKYWSIAAGLILITGSGAWYFTQPGHFASPDVEGIESFVLLALGILAATAIQFSLSLLVQRAIAGFSPERSRVKYAEGQSTVERLDVEVEEYHVTAFYYEPAEEKGLKTPLLLIHDYGGSKENLNNTARRLSLEGHPVVTFDMDGHGDNPRGISGPFMEKTSAEMLKALRRSAGNNEVAVVGFGFGGLVAIHCAHAFSETVKAVAIDPIVIGPDGAPSINSLRELDILDVISALLHPSALDVNKRQTGLFETLEHPSFPKELPSENITVIATKDIWLNKPGKSKEFALDLNLNEPAWVARNHYSLRNSDEVRNLIQANFSS